LLGSLFSTVVWLLALMAAPAENVQYWRRRFVVRKMASLGGWLALLCMQITLAAAEPASRPAQTSWYLMGDEIYANRAAAEKVLQARKLDPMWGADLSQRDLAAQLYAEAIELQPGAAINAFLADRVAQMYTFNADPARGIRTDAVKAALWWKRAREWASPRTELYQQAIIGGGPGDRPPREVYEAILDLEEKQLEWPAWKFLPGSAAGTVPGKTMDGPLASAPQPQASPQYDAAMAQVRQHGRQLKRIIAERVVMLVKSQYSGEPGAKEAIVEELHRWAGQYEGSEVGEYFEQAAMEVLNPPKEEHRETNAAPADARAAEEAARVRSK